jgi:hypothetical protein
VFTPGPQVQVTMRAILAWKVLVACLALAGEETGSADPMDAHRTHLVQQLVELSGCTCKPGPVQYWCWWSS